MTGIGDVESRVTITLHTEHDDSPEVAAGVQRTLSALASELDEGGRG